MKDVDSWLDSVAEDGREPETFEPDFPDDQKERGSEDNFEDPSHSPAETF